MSQVQHMIPSQGRTTAASSSQEAKCLRDAPTCSSKRVACEHQCVQGPGCVQRQGSVAQEQLGEVLVCSSVAIGASGNAMAANTGTRGTEGTEHLRSRIDCLQWSVHAGVPNISSSECCGRTCTDTIAAHGDGRCATMQNLMYTKLMHLEDR